MDILVGFRDHLITCTPIAALVVARVYTPILPQKTVYPAIQVQLISDVDGLHLRGPIGLPTVRLQVDCWAATRDQVFTLGRLVRQRVNGFAGEWIGDKSTSPAGRLGIRLAEYVNGSERYEEDVNGGFCRHSGDYLVTYKDVSDQVLI